MSDGHDNQPHVGAPSDRERPSLIEVVANRAFWCVGALFVVGLLTALTWFTIPLAIALLPLVVLVLYTSIAVAANRVRRQRALVILGYVGQAVRLNLPLPAMLNGAALAERRTTRRRLEALATCLASGAALTDAIAETVPDVQPTTLALLRAAERSGSLDDALQRLLTDARPSDELDPLSRPFVTAYPLAMALVTVSVLSAFLILVLPKYEGIYHDFRLQLPPVTRLVMSVSRAYLLPVATGTVLVLALVVGRAAERTFRGGPAFAGAFDWLLDRLAWATPWVGAAARDAGLADVFTVMCDATRHGQPLHRAVEEASRLSVNGVLRRRIARWADALSHGVPPADAARAARLPAIVAGMFGPVRAREDASRVCAFLERYYRSRFSRARLLIGSAVVPLVSLTFGVVVGTVALAMFMPLVLLSESLAGLATP